MRVGENCCETTVNVTSFITELQLYTLWQKFITSFMWPVAAGTKQSINDEWILHPLQIDCIKRLLTHPDSLAAMTSGSQLGLFGARPCFCVLDTQY